MTNPTLRVTAGKARDFALSSQLEWLETNGTGAFAMGTVAGVNTRRYHALLVASLNPPVERFVALSRVEEEVITEAGRVALGVAQYPGALAPQGYQFLEQFQPEPCATWHYAANGTRVEKQVYLVDGRQSVVLRYRADRTVRLMVRPFLAFRDYHSLSRANDSFNGALHKLPAGFRMQPYASLPPVEFHSPGAFRADPHWYYQHEYLAERDRGLDFSEDLYTPGLLEFDLRSNEWATICVSVDGTSEAGEPPASKRDPFLVQRANGQPTLIAGYPWFTDWGRDTMISLPGLLVARGRFQEARGILQGFLQFLNNGLLPNHFPDAGHLPEYNTADATLWMFEAVRWYVTASRDLSFLREVFYGEARQIIEWHRRGTSYGIQVDPHDHLLAAGTPGTQLTWMDARVGDRVMVPRHGKPVEINALWHSALRLMAEWGRRLQDPAAEHYRDEADRVRHSFVEQFWNESRGCLYDVIAPDGPVAKLRPNQVFAVSLPYPLLSTQQQQSVMRVVEQTLLTPVGLRTLEPGDAEYQGRYEGGVDQRDGAYHQGSVWPWLLGPYIDAHLNAFGKTDATLAYCRNLTDKLAAESAAHGCLGSLAEIYDGEEPRHPRGCPAQAWSVAELARVRWAHGL